MCQNYSFYQNSETWNTHLKNSVPAGSQGPVDSPLTDPSPQPQEPPRHHLSLSTDTFSQYLDSHTSAGLKQKKNINFHNPSHRRMAPQIQHRRTNAHIPSTLIPEAPRGPSLHSHGAQCAFSRASGRAGSQVMRIPEASYQGLPLPHWDWEHITNPQSLGLLMYTVGGTV